MADTSQQNSNGEVTITLPPLLRKLVRLIPRSTAKAALFLLAVGAGLGLVLAIAFESVSWYRARPLPTRDLGSAKFDAIGLRGNLVVKWDEKAEYRVKFAPIEQTHVSSFALMVSDPPRPLQIEIHLSDASGFTLCSKQIVLRYDFYKNLPPQNQSASDLWRAAMAYENAADSERSWERDKDIFRRDLASDGTVAAISSEGELPCSRNAFKEAARWSFSSTFLTTAEQDSFAKAHSENAAQLGTARTTQTVSQRGWNAKPISAASRPSRTEGYDTISGYSVVEDNIERKG